MSSEYSDIAKIYSNKKDNSDFVNKFIAEREELVAKNLSYEQLLDLAASYAVFASAGVHAITMFEPVVEKKIKEYKSRAARHSVTVKLENDPIQAAKKNIEVDFKSSKYPFDKYGYKAKFINEMQKKYPIITSRKTIENLVTKLYKENKLIPR